MNTKNILIEIGMEELPYKNLHKISNTLKDILTRNLATNKIKFNNIKNFITLRRIAFKILNIEILNKKYLEEKIKIIIESLINEINFEVKMKWNDSIKPFVRPVKWYVLMLNNKIINHCIFNIKSSNNSFCHKTIKKEIKINADNYEILLKNNGKVICDHTERKNIIIKKLIEYARKSTLNIVLKKNTINNITNITEYPVFIICNFKKELLKLPEEIITTTILKQYFCFLFKKKNKLINKILIIIDSFKNLKKIKKNYEYILNTKLFEVKYLYEKEKAQLEKHNLTDLKKLEFNDTADNMYEKTKKITNIAIFIKKQLNLKAPKLSKATNLIKMDLLTKISNEIPELVGLICCYNVKNDKIVKNYLYNYNRIINNNIVNNKISSIIALADKIENISSFFIAKKNPSGSKDPFKLKNDAKLIIKIIKINKLKLNIDMLIAHIIKINKLKNNNLKNNIKTFILNRLNLKINYYKIIKTDTDILNIIVKTKILKNISKYMFKNDLTKINKRLTNLTEKNNIKMQKINTNLFIKEIEYKLFDNLKKHIHSTNALKKQNLLFESIKTHVKLKKQIENYFKCVLILDKNENLKKNRLKLLNVIKRIFNSELNINFI